MLSESPRRRVASRCRRVRAVRTKGVRQWLPEAVALGKRKCRCCHRQSLGGTATCAAAPLGRGGVAVVQAGARELPLSARGRSLRPSPEGEKDASKHRVNQARVLYLRFPKDPCA
ncbi:hypothetical protein E1301_Tti016296 [Triplophysa tibetana]|uniref:Uncharacterized protein n=1 Tax=Triplophysa tibetana TaxID=1572043 RepID=A0A5A9PSS3_9TELE|nr:hypothetical protein E1301_Tti016296 [Triplophysa tibetana]